MARARGPRDADIERAATLARWLDNRFLDPILGFVMPGVGDIVSSGAGLYILSLAIRKGLPKIVIARMLFNLAVDTAVGAIPIAGDVFDVFFKANTRNMRLLEQRHGSGGSPADWLVVAGAAAAFGAALLIPIYLVIAFFAWLF